MWAGWDFDAKLSVGTVIAQLEQHNKLRKKEGLI